MELRSRRVHQHDARACFHDNLHLIVVARKDPWSCLKNLKHGPPVGEVELSQDLQWRLDIGFREMGLVASRPENQSKPAIHNCIPSPSPSGEKSWLARLEQDVMPYPADDLFGALTATEVGKHDRLVTTQLAGVALHNGKIRSYMRRQVGLVNHQ